MTIDDFAKFQAAYDQDKARVGTRHFQGMAWFHAYAYRFVLRSPTAYQQMKGRKTCPASKWWTKKYQAIHHALLDAGLDVSGCSPAHTTIIEKVLRFPAGALSCDVDY